MLSLGIIIIAMIVVVGTTGLCSYEPGAPESGPVREVDAESFMGMEARATNFPVRLPENPEGWMTNSARRSMIDGTQAPVVGWVTADRGYIALTQTMLPLDDAVKNIDSDFRELSRTEDIAGQEVRIYHSDESDVRDLWAVDMGEVRLLFTGAGSQEEFRTIIAATIYSAPLPSA